MPPVKLNKFGAKSVYHDSYPELVERLALLGQTEEETARTLGVDFNTFRRWMREKPVLRAARAEGCELADAKVAQSLFKRANGYTHKAVKIFPPRGDDKDPLIVEYVEQYPPDTGAAALILANRQRARWKLKPGEDEGQSAGLTVKVVGGLPDD